MCRSVWHTPQHRTRSSTSPARGSGGARLRRSNGADSTGRGLDKTIAFTGLHSRPAPRRPGRVCGGRRNRPANSRHMRLWLAAFVVLLLGACAPSAPVGLTEVHDERGFTVRYPQRWTQVRRDDAVWFVPAGADRIPDVAEFIVVVTRASAGRLGDPAIRRTVFELLPVQGLSGFQQDPRTTTEALWHQVGVTGASGGQEWASVGVLVSGATRYHVVVCAKPLGKWRGGQKQCDEGGRRIQPGDLNH